MAGVEIYVCGQSATSRGYKPEEIDDARFVEIYGREAERIG